MTSPDTHAPDPGADAPRTGTPPTFGELVAARATDDATALFFDDDSWTWREVVAEAGRRAALARELLDDEDDRPSHIGLALENSPENLFWWLGAALAGITVVGINPTRHGAELERDISFTDCRVLVLDASRRELLTGLELAAGVTVLDTDAPGYGDRLAAASDPRAAGGGVPTRQGELPGPETLLSLIFTSGTTSAPKAVRCTQGRMGRIALQQAERRSLTAADTFYVVMPMFHSNAIMAGVAPAVATGGSIVLRRKFSASGWLEDVRRFGVTFFNYVGKPLNFILATPEREDDADNPLRIAFGNEASERDIARFSARFDCTVIDSFGSSEGEISIRRTPETPSGSLGVAPEGVIVVDPETGAECPRAELDEHGRVSNPEAATGEIVHTAGAHLFEGYYDNPEADAQRLRGGWVWSGDLAYRDRAGYFYFAGRSADWLRVDGENIAAAPIERLLMRFGAFAAVAVVATPDEVVGDQVLAVAELEVGARFDPDAFVAFLAEQPDLGSKWTPRYLRIIDALPRTPSNKIVKRDLAPVSETAGLWLRDGSAYRPAPPRPAPRM